VTCIFAFVILAIVAGEVVVRLDRNRQAVAKAAELARYMEFKPENAEYIVKGLMSDDEMITSLLANDKGKIGRGGTVAIDDFPTVTIAQNACVIEQGGKTYEFYVDGNLFRIIERGARGGMRETRLNTTALLRVIVGLGLAKEKRNGRNKPAR
jgi:hypothetical protein